VEAFFCAPLRFINDMKLLIKKCGNLLKKSSKSKTILEQLNLGNQSTIEE
jgi:hypothetical protein